MDDHLYGVQDTIGSTSVDLSKGIVVYPLLSFYFLFSIFFVFFCGLKGSFYISLICPLWDLLICPLWDLFLTLGNTLYYKKYRRSFTLYKSTQHKEDEAIMMYASICLCQCS